jgi:hypothetical protein
MKARGDLRMSSRRSSIKVIGDPRMSSRTVEQETAVERPVGVSKFLSHLLFYCSPAPLLY